MAGAGLGLLGLFVLQGYCTTDLFTPGGVLDGALAAGDRQWLLCVFLVMAVGFGCKAGMFPLHAWLPIAHPVAPAPASAVLSGLITKMGVFALIRVVYYLYGLGFPRRDLGAENGADALRSSRCSWAPLWPCGRIH